MATSLALACAALAIAGCESTPTDEERLVVLRDRAVERGDVAAGTAPLDALRVAGPRNAALLTQLDRAGRTLMARARVLEQVLAARPDARYLEPTEHEALRQVSFDLLQLTRLCARVADDHHEVESIALVPEDLRAEGLTLRLCATLIALDASHAVVEAFDEVKLARQALNQPLARDHIPSRLFERLDGALRSLRARARIRTTIDRFQAAEVQRQVVGTEGPRGERMLALARRIYASPAYDDLRQDESLERILARGPEKVAEAAAEAGEQWVEMVYPLQVFVANIIGDLETSDRAPFLTEAEAAALRPDLQPGDILLRRCDFFVSNAFLPGWWGHAAVWVGTRAEVEALGLADDPRVKPHLDGLTGGHQLVEAVGEGVQIGDYGHFMEADHVAVLRLRGAGGAPASADARREVVARAFAEVGKAYDFQFDFETDDTVVCSEVVFRACAKTATFPLVPRFGRYTLTPDDIAQAAARDDGPLALVRFYKDGKLADEAAFREALR